MSNLEFMFCYMSIFILFSCVECVAKSLAVRYNASLAPSSLTPSALSPVSLTLEDAVEDIGWFEKYKNRHIAEHKFKV